MAEDLKTGTTEDLVEAVPIRLVRQIPDLVVQELLDKVSVEVTPAAVVEAKFLEGVAVAQQDRDRMAPLPIAAVVLTDLIHREMVEMVYKIR
jgi:hypothetical protein